MTSHIFDPEICVTVNMRIDTPLGVDCQIPATADGFGNPSGTVSSISLYAAPPEIELFKYGRITPVERAASSFQHCTEQAGSMFYDTYFQKCN